jgi:hypothetical protein
VELVSALVSGARKFQTRGDVVIGAIGSFSQGLSARLQRSHCPLLPCLLCYKLGFPDQKNRLETVPHRRHVVPRQPAAEGVPFIHRS